MRDMVEFYGAYPKYQDRVKQRNIELNSTPFQYKTTFHPCVFVDPKHTRLTHLLSFSAKRLEYDITMCFDLSYNGN